MLLAMANCAVFDLLKNGGDVSSTRFNLYAVAHLLQRLGDTQEPVNGRLGPRCLWHCATRPEAILEHH